MLASFWYGLSATGNVPLITASENNWPKYGPKGIPCPEKPQTTSACGIVERQQRWSCNPVIQPGFEHIPLLDFDHEAHTIG